MNRHVPILAAATLTVPLLIAAPAAAAPPGNDSRASAERLTPPQTLSGSLVGATVEIGEPTSRCAATDASVWYRFTATDERIIVQLDAGGDMDATVDLYQRSRSKYSPIGCEATDKKGIATLERSRLEKGGEYAIRIGKEFGSSADRFQLRVLIPSPPPRPPGKPLPVKGVRDSVDRLANPGDAYRRYLPEGRTMKVSLKSKSCTSLTIYPPGTQSFDGDFLKRLRCGGYGLFTAEEAGRYSFLVEAARGRERQRYRLQVAPAGRDDTTPGVFIRNNAKVRGKVNGGIDNTDLYRFDVTRRSLLTLRVSGGPDLLLTTSAGRRLGSGSLIDRRIKAGRYYAAVSGSGKYTLKRKSRTITSARLTFNGRKKAVTSPGSSAALRLSVSPGASGPAKINVDRLDPVAGWQHVRTYRVSVAGGSGSLRFVPPSIGRYRANAEFRGTTTTAPSSSRTAVLVVQGPLVD